MNDFLNKIAPNERNKRHKPILSSCYIMSFKEKSKIIKDIILFNFINFLRKEGNNIIEYACFSVLLLKDSWGKCIAYFCIAAGYANKILYKR